MNIYPRFLGEAGRRFFLTQFRAEAGPRAHVLFIPPFGEEMNRCRALVAEQSRLLAQSGYHCTVLDFFGTGDSEGELAQASLDIWYGNIELALNTLRREEPAPVVLWGLRLGALIAAGFVGSHEPDCREMLLWQPVTSGKRYINQLLRQRVASLVNSGLPPETTAEIRQRMQEGQRVEISGYFVSEPLVSELEALSLAAAGGAGIDRIHWLENIEQEGDTLSTAGGKMVDKLKEQGVDVQVSLFRGPPLWQLHKRDALPELMQQTRSILVQDSPRSLHALRF
ncbi:MAG: hydrolase 2, exosortase A system-associated [Halioglobus sp.]|nr:hydrolase 2, exosortase A system-associated [Halioglobus sp.]